MPVNKLFTPNDIFQGPADVYVDVATPPSAVPPVPGTNLLTLDALGQPNDTGSLGFHLGLTEGPCSVSFHPVYHEILADQFAAAIDAAFVSSTCDIEFAIKEYNLSRYPSYFAGLTTGNYFNLTAGGTNPAADLLRIGSSNGAAVNHHTLTLVAPRRNTSPQKYMYVMAYKAVLTSSIQFEFSRKKESVVKAKFRCLADTSRVGQDQVYQFVQIL